VQLKVACKSHELQMDKFRKKLLNESGIIDILKHFNVHHENRATSSNITLFIGFENSGKRELVEKIGGFNSMDYDLIDDFSTNVVQKMSNAITLSEVLKQI
jgi:hypothetical protein